LAAQADLIVSGDAHLLDLKQYQRIQIVSSAEALQMLVPGRGVGRAIHNSASGATLMQTAASRLSCTPNKMAVEQINVRRRLWVIIRWGNPPHRGDLWWRSRML
jgi:hypothetical protein